MEYGPASRVDQGYENLYDPPNRLAVPILRATRLTALAMKSAFGCEGVSTRQHNEPAANQDVGHFHVHVFPRFPDDDLYRLHDEWRWVSAEEMRECANRLRAAWPTAGSA